MITSHELLKKHVADSNIKIKTMQLSSPFPSFHPIRKTHLWLLPLSIAAIFFLLIRYFPFSQPGRLGLVPNLPKLPHFRYTAMQQRRMRYSSRPRCQARCNLSLDLPGYLNRVCLLDRQRSWRETPCRWGPLGRPASRRHWTWINRGIHQQWRWNYSRGSRLECWPSALARSRELHSARYRRTVRLELWHPERSPSQLASG